MNILAVTLRYPPYTAGGYELLTRDAVESLRDKGHTVQVLTGRGADFEDDPQIHPLLSPGLDGEEDPWTSALEADTPERIALHFFRFANYQAARKVVARTRPDVALFFNMGLVSLSPLLAFRHANLPTLGYVADPWPTNHWLSSWRADERAASAKAGRLAVLERAWRMLRELVELGPMLVASGYLEDLLAESGIDRETIDVLPLGLPPDMARAASESARTDVTRRERGEPLRVVCASSLWQGKGQSFLIEAVAGARAMGADIHLTLAGGGLDSYRRELQQLVRSLELEQSVHFAGSLPRAELARLLESSHVMAVPSTWGEPFGLVTLEGMAHGLAVVASDAGASPELVRDGVDGRIVRAGDADALGRALTDLAKDEEGRQGLARAARAGVDERFSHDTFIARLELALRASVHEA